MASKITQDYPNAYGPQRRQTPEEAEERRRKSLALIKASNQLLDESADWARNTKTMTEGQKKGIIFDIENAKEENLRKVREQCHATKEEVDNVEFTEVDPSSVAKYQAALKKHGRTMEDIARKDIGLAVASADKSKTETTKRRRRSRISGLIDEEIVRLPNEQELMEKSLVKRGEEEKIENNRRRNTRTQKTPEEKQDEMAAAKMVEIAQNQAPVVDSPRSVNSEPHILVDDEAVKLNQSYDVYNFKPVAEGVTWDMIPLPSKGECYKHKRSSIPVRSITADDENIIASPNMYRDNKILDTILANTILLKDFDPRTLCKGDREAILLWLRMDAYDKDFPILARNPETGKQYNVNVDLSTFKVKDFNLKGDENGLFEYRVDNPNQDVIKFRFLSAADDEIIRANAIKNSDITDKYDIINYANRIKGILERNSTLSNDNKQELKDCVEDISAIIEETTPTEELTELTPQTVTEQMIQYTMAVNGNYDRDYIASYIRNMKAGYARKYRQYVADNTPGMDMSVKVQIPQSDGGGSFETFLRLDNFIFINV